VSWHALVAAALIGTELRPFAAGDGERTVGL
jgi:hypothetical protein